jgi:hypothetical protein
MLNFKQLTASTVAAISLALPATAVAQHQDLRSADALDSAHQAENPTRRGQDLRMPDRRTPDTGVRVPQVEPVTAPTVRVVEVQADGFDWGDAGIGAAGGLAILTLAGGMATVATHRRRGEAIS